jgi:hypothetical protein
LVDLIPPSSRLGSSTLNRGSLKWLQNQPQNGQDLQDKKIKNLVNPVNPVYIFLYHDCVQSYRRLQ